MSSPGDVTLASYEAAAERYRVESPPPPSAHHAFLDRVAGLAAGGSVLEVGSGPGNDAAYLERKGVVVLRSDGARAFVDMMRADGHPAHLLDVRRDDLGGPYAGILAIAVLLHLTRVELEAFLVRARESVPNGFVAFTVKAGDGEAWSTAKLDLPRHYTYWQEAELRAVLRRAGWVGKSIEHVDGRSDRWLVVIAEPGAVSSAESRGVIVRRAKARDAVVIASLLNAFVATTTIDWTETLRSVESIVDWLDEHETVLVAEHDGEVVAVAASGWFRDVAKRPGYRFTVETTVHVREDHWRSGVGRTLMDALIEEARRSGKHTIVAVVDGANEMSIRFHEHLGFVQVARIPELGAKFGRWLDLVLMALRLDDRSAPPDGDAFPDRVAGFRRRDLVIGVDDPRASDVRSLLETHLAFSHAVTPAGHVHALGIDGLVDPTVTFVSARRDGTVLGVGALKELDPGHGELKSMHTAAASRRRGVGRAIVEHLLALAADRGYDRVSLETGTMTAFAPARTLYECIGFVPCEPFGEYTANPNSTCMSIVIGRPGPADARR